MNCHLERSPYSVSHVSECSWGSLSKIAYAATDCNRQDKAHKRLKQRSERAGGMGKRVAKNEQSGGEKKEEGHGESQYSTRYDSTERGSREEESTYGGRSRGRRMLE